MKYSLYVNQSRALELGINNVNQAHIFDLLTSASTWATPINIGEDVHYWVARQMISSELPLLKLKPDTVYRHLKKLAELGLIEHQKDGKKDCILITDLGRSYLTDGEGSPYVGNRSELAQNSEIDPRKLGNRSEKHSEINPTYPTTNINPTTKDQTNLNFAALDEFLSYRKQIKKPLKPASIEKLKTKLANLDQSLQQEAIDMTIANGWQGLQTALEKLTNAGASRGKGKQSVKDRLDEQRRSAESLVRRAGQDDRGTPDA